METDPEAFLPAPDVVKRSAGKASSLRDWPDDHDSDIEVLEVLDPVLISYLHLALFECSANPDAQIHEVPPLATGGPALAPSQKRAATPAAASEAPPPKKRQKKSAVKPSAKPATKSTVRRAPKPQAPPTSDE